jgi:hypothetical protein
VKGEGGAGGNNLESSFPTLTAKVASTERQTKYSWWTQNVRASGGTASYIGQALRSTASRCQKCGNGGVPSGCVKSETGKKRPSAKIDGTRSRALRGATGAKSGGFWQPLSQDVALCCIHTQMISATPTL